MKKVVLFASFVMMSLALSAQQPAQLAGSKWKGTLQGDEPQEVVFDFRKDTAVVYTRQDSSHVETMTYTFKDKVLTLIKVEGISGCDSTPGKYTVTFEKDALIMKKTEDPCDDRSSAVEGTKWMRFTSAQAPK